MVNLEVDLNGLRLRRPVMTASGCFGFGEEYYKLGVHLNELGAIVCKTITLEPRQGNPGHRIWETPSGMLNSIGLENPGIDGFIGNKVPFLRQFEIPIIVSIAGFKTEEYGLLAHRLEEVRDDINALEVNISCPNVEGGKIPFGATPEPAFKVTKIVKENTSLPVIVKLTPNVSAPFEEIVLAVEEGGADILSMINTLLGMAINIETRKPRIRKVFAGLSGPAIHPHALVRVRQAYKVTRLPIIGIGGIAKWQDAVEFFLAGASAVGIGTFTFTNPNIFHEVIEGLKKYLEDNNYTGLKEIIGQMIEPE